MYRHSRRRLLDVRKHFASAAHFGGFQPESLLDFDTGLLVDIDVPWLPSATRVNPNTFWAQIDVDVLKSGRRCGPFQQTCDYRGGVVGSLRNLPMPLKREPMLSIAWLQRSALRKPGNRSGKPAKAGRCSCRPERQDRRDQSTLSLCGTGKISLAQTISSSTRL